MSFVVFILISLASWADSIVNVTVAGDHNDLVVDNRKCFGPADIWVRIDSNNGDEFTKTHKDLMRDPTKEDRLALSACLNKDFDVRVACGDAGPPGSDQFAMCMASAKPHMPEPSCRMGQGANEALKLAQIGAAVERIQRSKREDFLYLQMATLTRRMLIVQLAQMYNSQRFLRKFNQLPNQDRFCAKPVQPIELESIKCAYCEVKVDGTIAKPIDYNPFFTAVQKEGIRLDLEEHEIMQAVRYAKTDFAALAKRQDQRLKRKKALEDYIRGAEAMSSLGPLWQEKVRRLKTGAPVYISPSENKQFALAFDQSISQSIQTLTAQFERVREIEKRIRSSPPRGARRQEPTDLVKFFRRAAETAPEMVDSLAGHTELTERDFCELVSRHLPDVLADQPVWLKHYELVNKAAWVLGVGALVFGVGVVPSLAIGLAPTVVKGVGQATDRTQSVLDRRMKMSMGWENIPTIQSALNIHDQQLRGEILSEVMKQAFLATRGMKVVSGIDTVASAPIPQEVKDQMVNLVHPNISTSTVGSDSSKPLQDSVEQRSAWIEQQLQGGRSVKRIAEEIRRSTDGAPR